MSRLHVRVELADGTIKYFRSYWSLAQFLNSLSNPKEEIKAIGVENPKWGYWHEFSPNEDVEDEQCWREVTYLYRPDVARRYNLCNSVTSGGYYTLFEILEAIRRRFKGDESDD